MISTKKDKYSLRHLQHASPSSDPSWQSTICPMATNVMSWTNWIEPNLPYHNASDEGCNRSGWRHIGRMWTDWNYTAGVDTTGVHLHHHHNLSGNLRGEKTKQNRNCENETMPFSKEIQLTTQPSFGNAFTVFAFKVVGRTIHRRDYVCVVNKNGWLE